MKNPKTEEAETKRYSVLDILKKNNPDVRVTPTILKKFVNNPGESFRDDGRLFTPAKTEKLLRPYISASAMRDIKSGNVKEGAKLVQRGSKYVFAAAKGGLVTDSSSSSKKQKKENRAKGPSKSKSETKYSCGLFKQGNFKT